nr:MAG TPA: hypothetical protein [Bacteriophage sp.]DAV16021.1 MAG TPA: hypothetical protein [Caudoviricetes sp.]
MLSVSKPFLRLSSLFPSVAIQCLTFQLHILSALGSSIACCLFFWILLYYSYRHCHAE